MPSTGQLKQIKQEQDTYKSPSDKRAVGYLLEEQFDLKELYNALDAITPEDGSKPVVTAQNVSVIENTLSICVSHLQKRIRARRAEEEAYKVSRDSVYGWKAVKEFERGGLFDDEEFGSETPIWQKPDLSMDKKLEKMKQADREAKFKISNQFKSGRPSFTFEGQSDSQAFKPNRPYSFPHRDTRICRRCHAPGHIASFCPASTGRHPPQHQRPGQGNLPPTSN